MEISNYKDSYKSLIADFNNRLEEGGAIEGVHRFPLGPDDLDFSDPDALVNQEIFVILVDGLVRGAIILKHQEYQINGSVVDFIDIQHPLTEAVINKKYSRLSLYLLGKFSKFDYVHGLGMGGLDGPLPQIMKLLKYELIELPFLFYALNIGALVKVVLKRKGIRSGLILSLISKPLSVLSVLPQVIGKGILAAKTRNLSIEPLDVFTEQDDVLWDDIKDDYSLIAVKNSRNLNVVYANKKFKFKKYRVFEGDKYIGWFSVLITKFEDDKYFLDSKVCTILDVVSHQKHWVDMIRMIKVLCLDNACDMIIHSNLNAPFISVLKQHMFIQGPSNFAFAMKLKDTEIDLSKMWITRIDGDGPINL